MSEYNMPQVHPCKQEHKLGSFEATQTIICQTLQRIESHLETVSSQGADISNLKREMAQRNENAKELFARVTRLEINEKGNSTKIASIVAIISTMISVIVAFVTKSFSK